VRCADCAQTQKLQQENAELRARMAELEGANRALAREAYGWRSRCEQPAGQPLGSTQQQQQLGAPARLLSPFPTPNPTAEKRVGALSIRSHVSCCEACMSSFTLCMACAHAPSTTLCITTHQVVLCPLSPNLWLANRLLVRLVDHPSASDPIAPSSSLHILSDGCRKGAIGVLF
jgi:hypothetical protein